MNIENLIFQVLVGVIATTLSIAIGWYLIRPQLMRIIGERMMQPSRPADATNYQAKERLIVFIDRINPINLLMRVSLDGLRASDLQAILIREIREEFHHNVAQQLYISGATWQTIRTLKDDTVGMIKNVTDHLPPDATGNEMARQILAHISKVTESPYDLTIELIKQD